MDGDLLLQGGKELGRYLRSFDELLGRPENRTNFAAIVHGQLSSVERKSLEPIADQQGLLPRSLQRFFSQAVWDEDGVRDELQRRVANAFGGDEGVFIIDDTSDAKKGEWTAGIQRQYCGESGKIENCIVSVHLVYAHRDVRALLDGDLFLPESWNPDPSDPKVQRKRSRAGIPAVLGHVSKLELARRQVERALKNGVPGRWVTADEAYGDKRPWRESMADLGLRYVVEVSPSQTRGWCRPPQAVPRQNSRKCALMPSPDTPARTLAELRDAPDGLRLRKRIRIRVKDTHKGAEIWEFKESRHFQLRGVRKQGHGAGIYFPEERLLVAQNLRTGEVKYFLSNDLDSPLETLAKVAFSRWHIERCFQDCKQDLGLNHAEIRNYRGLRRHFILTAVTYFFVQDFVQRHGAKKGGP